MTSSSATCSTPSFCTPGLLDAGVPADRINQTLAAVGQSLVDLSVRCIHASLSAAGTAVHLHDPMSWLPGHPQLVTLQSILAAPGTDHARALVARGRLVNSGDVRAAVAHSHAAIACEACWQWPFTPTIEYLVWAIAAKNQSPATDEPHRSQRNAACIPKIRIARSPSRTQQPNPSRTP